MNKDKRIDIVAARYMGGVGELLWLQQPYEKDGGWNIRKIHEACFQTKSTKAQFSFIFAWNASIK